MGLNGPFCYGSNMTTVPRGSHIGAAQVLRCLESLPGSRAGLTLVATLALSACTDSPNGPDNTGGTTTEAGGQSAAGGLATGGLPTASGGSGGTDSSDGAGGGPASGGSSSGGVEGSGGASSGGGAGSSTGGSAGGQAGSGGTGNAECTRALLDGLLDDYFAALAAGDPSSLPLAGNVRFTENAQVSEIGATEFWGNAGPPRHSQRALDTEACMAATQAVIPEGTTDRPVAIRIKVEQAEITEVETIVVREGDYALESSNPEAIIQIAGDIGWHDEVPEPQRATREELIGWVDKYFRLFPSGVCNVTPACRRLENGGGDYACSFGASCTPADPGPSDAVFEPRLLLADVERGIAVGFTIFDFTGPGHVDMHMAKIYGGEVHAVQAILRNTNGESGWD